MSHLAVHVCAKRCDRCLFSKNRYTTPSRAKQLTEANLAADAFFECHMSTRARGGYEDAGVRAERDSEENVMCRGFFDAYGMERPSQMARIVERLTPLTQSPYIFVEPVTLTPALPEPPYKFPEDWPWPTTPDAIAPGATA